MNNLQVGNSGNYTVIATGPGGSLASSNAVLSVVNSSPIITTSPVGQSVPAGTNVMLSVGVKGSLPVSFQWQFNSQNIPGATNASLTVTDAQATNAGTYNLLATNNYGTTNATIHLTVNSSAPVLTAQPGNQSVLIGGSAVLQTAARGTEPLNFQWTFNNSNILGATNPTLVLSNLQLTNAGNYQATVSNTVGMSNSTVAVLTVGRSVVVAWGYNGSGQTNVPPGLTNVAALAAGQSFNLAARSDGTVVAWGDNLGGESAIPIGLNNVVAVSGGQEHSLSLLSNGTIVAWGANVAGDTQFQGQSNITAISAGQWHSLALKSDGTIIGRGMNGYGESTPPADLSNVVAIAAGDYHSVALKSDGTVIAWGYNYEGATNVPNGLSNVVAVATGGYFGLALKSDGTVVTWGDNNDFEQNIPAGLSNVVAIAAGSLNCLALLSNGTVVEWGYPAFGLTTFPARLTNVVAISGGSQHSVALLNDGSPYIARQPFNQTTYSGMSLVISAGVVGVAPLSYQWQFNQVNIAGATNSSLTFTNVAMTNQGIYSLMASNAYGAAVSSNTMLTVLRSTPQFDTSPGSVQFSSNGFGIRLKGLSSDGQIIIYRSTNLVNWVPIFTNPPVTGTLQFIDPSATNVPAQFYRAEEQ